MGRGDEPDAFDDFDSRLEALRAQEARREARQERKPQRLDWGSGIQVGIEVIAGVVGGTVLGYALDHWLGTGPLFLIVMFLLGSMAGMLNAYRSLRRFMRNEPGGPGPG
jgi:ATP synthase protein I